MTPIDQQSLIDAGQRYGIPPAILYGISMQGPMPNSSTLAQNYGFSQAELDQSPQLAAQVMAMALKDGFSKYGSWQGAISAYASGDPNQYQSVTSPIGGYVTGALAVAAANADMGLSQSFGQGMDPRMNYTLWQKMAQDFGGHIDEYAKQGGVITPQTAQSYRMGLAVTTQGLHDSHNLSFDTNYPVKQFDAHPFDASWLGQETENFNYGGEEVGNDYGTAQGTQMVAAMGGVVQIRNYAGRLDTFIKVQSGPMAGWEIGYGHMHSVNVQDGQVVQAGQPIGASGGAVNDPNAGNSTGPHLEFQLRDPQGRWHDPQPLLEATLGRQASMAQGGMGGPEQQQQKPPDPQAAEIDKFAAEAKRLGLSPNDFQQAGKYAKLMRRQGLTPNDMEAFAQTKGMDDPTLLEHIHNRVHPDYPDVQVGEFNRVRDTADMYGMLHVGRTANAPEVVRLLKAQANNSEIQNYFKQQNQDQEAIHMKRDQGRLD